MVKAVLTLPETIRTRQSLTPNEMRALKAATGRTLDDLLGGEAEDMDRAPDRIQSLVWCALRRAGHDVTWDQAGDVAPDMTDEPVDPTGNGNSTPSSTSADGGA